MALSSNILIIGGGTAGITIAARLLKAEKNLKVKIIDPAERHYYQPLWTLVGGGLATLEETDRKMGDVIPRNVAWVKEHVNRINPKEKIVHTEEGSEHSYDALVVAPGIRLAMEEVEGLTEALANDHRVWTNYSVEYVNKGVEAINTFNGGDSYFTFPNSPVKCGGGPQKIMWITEQWLVKNKVKEASTVNFIAPGGEIFGVPKYRDALQLLVEDRGIKTHFKQHLVAINHKKSEIILENVETKERSTKSYDLLHVTPPQRAFDFVKKSGIANDAGFVDVNRETLQHVTYPEIFSAGDASSLPTAKTGAAIRKQAPILVHNLIAHLKQNALKPSYDGYTSCPLVVSHNKVILAEFGYDGSILETFPFNQAKPRRSMYLLKRFMLPKIYFLGMLKGKM